MPSHFADNTPLWSGKGIFLVLLLALFASELVVMELFASWFSSIGRIPAALVDSFMLVLLLSWPLGLVAFHPELARQGKKVSGISPVQWHLLGKVLTTIFAVNFFLMLLKPQFWVGIHLRFGNLLDAGLVTAISAPFLWKLLYPVETQDTQGSFREALGTPLGIYVLLLGTVLSVDLLQGALFPLFVPSDLNFPYSVLDAIITTVLVAPIFWLVVARPLRSAALTEKTRKVAILGQVLDAVVTTDSTGIVKSINPAAERIFGLQGTEMVGKPAARLFEGGESVFNQLAAGRDSGGGAGEPFVELAGRRWNGLKLTMEVSFSLILLDDCREFLLIMRDITSRKEAAQALRESEHRFRETFEQSEDAIVFFKPGGCSIIDVNNTTIRLFGYVKEELFTGGVEILFDDGDLARLKAMVGGVKKNSTSPVDTFNAKRKGGEEFVVAMRCKIMTLQGVDIVFCTFRDVTDRLRMEQEARDIQAKLIQANKMTSLGLLVSGVAHEINNPNNFILANAQLLARSWEDARKILGKYAAENGDFFIGGVPFSELDAHSPELFDGILDGARRINEIVKSLKGFARQDRFVAEARFDLNQVVTTAVNILHHELVRYTEHFQVELASELPPARGSAQQIGQVIINLLMNACQALPSKSHGIRLVTEWDLGNGQVLVSVQDEGCGISAEQSSRIMEPFFTTKLDSGGTGLGLSICQSIVREHQGSLEFSSVPGSGTTFAVRLPAAEPGKDPSPCPS